MFHRSLYGSGHIDHAHIRQFAGSRYESDPRDVQEGQNPCFCRIDDVAAEPFETIGSGRAGIDGRGYAASQTESIQVYAPM